MPKVPKAPKPAAAKAAAPTPKKTMAMPKRRRADGETCPVCLERVDDKPNAAVALVCGHKFHNVCIVKHLRRDRRCPVCRDDPAAAADESDESDDDSVEVCTQRLLLVFSLEMLNEALVRYGVSSHKSRRRAAVALAEILLCDTDDESDDA